MSTDAASAKVKKTASLMEVCSVRLGQTWFGVPIAHILEIVGGARPQPVPLAPEYVGGLVHYRGDVLTTVSLRQLLGLPAKEGASSAIAGPATSQATLSAPKPANIPRRRITNTSPTVRRYCPTSLTPPAAFLNRHLGLRYDRQRHSGAFHG